MAEGLESVGVGGVDVAAGSISAAWRKAASRELWLTFWVQGKVQPPSGLIAEAVDHANNRGEATETWADGPWDDMVQPGSWHLLVTRASSLDVLFGWLTDLPRRPILGVTHIRSDEPAFSTRTSGLTVSLAASWSTNSGHGGAASMSSFTTCCLSLTTCTSVSSSTAAA